MDAQKTFKVRYPDGEIREAETVVVRRSRKEAWHRGKLAHASSETVEPDYAGSFPGYIVMVTDEPDADGVRVTLAHWPVD